MPGVWWPLSSGICSIYALDGQSAHGVFTGLLLLCSNVTCYALNFSFTYLLVSLRTLLKDSKD
jgi:hypothetical protein